MPDNGVYHQVENRGGQRVALVHPTAALEGRAKLAASLLHHLQPIPLCPHEPEHTSNHALYHQYVKAHVLIQGVIHLMEIQEYGMEDRLRHDRQLLG